MRKYNKVEFVFVVIIVALIALVFGGVIFKFKIKELWYLHKMRSTKFEDKCEGMEKLTKMRSEKAIPLLIDELNNNVDSTLSWMAAAALGKYEQKKELIVPSLLSALDFNEKKVRISAARSLVELHAIDDKVILKFTKMLDDSSYSLRREMVKTIGDIGPPAYSACSAIEKLLTDDVAEVRNAAKLALNKIKNK